MDLDIKLGEIPELGSFLDYLTYKRPAVKPLGQYSLNELAAMNSNWKTSCMSKGLDNLLQNLHSRTVTYQVYEGSDDDELKDVQLYCLSSKGGKDRPIAFICSGGYYMYLSNLNEAFPVAAGLNDMGYDCCVLNYRVASDHEADKSLDDLANAVSMVIGDTKKYFPLHAENSGYIIAGFSAGANLTAMFGSTEIGYAKYGLKKPEALITAYPPIELDLFSPEQGTMLMKVMFGSKLLGAFDPVPYTFPAALGKDYPDTFIVHAKDDEVVSVEHSIRFDRMLQEKGIRHEMYVVDHAKHGFGLGLETDAAGWLERAVNFIEHK